MKVYIDIGINLSDKKPTPLEKLDEFLDKHDLRKHWTGRPDKYMAVIHDQEVFIKLHDLLGTGIYCVDMRKESEAHRRRGYMTNGG